LVRGVLAPPQSAQVARSASSASPRSDRIAPFYDGGATCAALTMHANGCGVAAKSCPDDLLPGHMYTSLMPYRTMELPDSLRPPAKWPRRAVLAAVTFVAIASGFMVLVELAAQIDGPGVGYGSRAVIVMMITAVAGFLGSLVLGVRWPTARAVGWSSGAAVAIAFIALRVP